MVRLPAARPILRLHFVFRTQKSGQAAVVTRAYERNRLSPVNLLQGDLIFDVLHEE